MMNTSRRNGMRLSSPVLAIVASALLLTACGGESTDPLPNTSSNSGTVTYTGPAPATDDVTNFKRSVWDNLATQNKCGACHGANGQSPTFVNELDINAAYGQANTIVNLSDPSQSRLVTKVAEGHNCWLASNAACVDILTTYLSNWAGGSAGTAKRSSFAHPP